MKHTPPQFDLPGMADAFNLSSQAGTDHERQERERAKLEADRKSAEGNQPILKPFTKTDFDFFYSYIGTDCHFHPMSRPAYAWLSDNFPKDLNKYWGNSLVIPQAKRDEFTQKAIAQGLKPKAEKKGMQL